MNDIWRDLLQGRADVTLVIGLVLAIGTTVHILLRKREVASAVGWIGLVWFAPIFGAISYLLFGVNRVRNLARQLRPMDDGPDGESVPVSPGAAGGLDALGRGVGHITARPLLAGTQVTVYQNGDEAYPPMLAAIAAAKSSIGLSSYIFRDDVWGGRFIAALADANQARGRGTRAHRRYRRRLAVARPPIIGYAEKASRPPASCIRCCPGGCRSSICATTRRSWCWTASLRSPAA